MSTQDENMLDPPKGAGIVRGDVLMGSCDTHNRFESVEDIMQKKMIEIWEKCSPDYYRMKMAEEFRWRKILKIRELRDSETNPETRNVLEEMYLQECRYYTCPTRFFEGRPC